MKYIWTNQYQEFFEGVKDVLIHAPIFRLLKFGERLEVIFDVSLLDIWAIFYRKIGQFHLKVGSLHLPKIIYHM
jgi:hypothetical protein